MYFCGSKPRQISMNIILYFILRRFFAEIRFSDSAVFLRKGIFFRRESRLPLSALTYAEIKRTPLLRVLRGKQVTLHSAAGNLVFFLRKWETLPFLPENRGAPLRPKRREILLAAFSDTRALSGIVIFSGTLSRIGKILGGEYYNRVILTITDTAERLAAVLDILHIYVPRITAVLAVFVVAAWLFSLLLKLLQLSRFTVFRGSETLTVRRGIFTLYEHTLVLNAINAAVSEKGVTAALIGYAPLYVRGVMIYPAADVHTAQRLARVLCRLPEAGKTVLRPPKKALFGHIAVPLGWGAALLGVIALCHAAFYLGYLPKMPVLRSLLWCGSALCGWLVFAQLIYMRRSFISAGENALCITARKGARLVSATLPYSNAARFEENQSLFQKRSGVFDFAVFVKQGGSIKLRHADYV